MTTTHVTSPRSDVRHHLPYYHREARFVIGEESAFHVRIAEPVRNWQTRHDYQRRDHPSRHYPPTEIRNFLASAMIEYHPLHRHHAEIPYEECRLGTDPHDSAMIAVVVVMLLPVQEAGVHEPLVEDAARDEHRQRRRDWRIRTSSRGLVQSPLHHRVYEDVPSSSPEVARARRLEYRGFHHGSAPISQGGLYRNTEQGEGYRQPLLEEEGDDEAIAEVTPV